MPRGPFEIAGVRVAPGERANAKVPIGSLYTDNRIGMPVHVVHGKRSGPVLFLSATLHGDELNGIEIARRVVAHKGLRRLRGTLLVVPVVNVLGILQKSRYLPDRRDLNRSFPGSPTGSLAARLAYSFRTEIVERSTHGIDLHTGAVYRENLPQVRGDLEVEAVREMAHAFGTPVILNSDLLEGSLRAAASDLGIPVLVYETGEALRFDEVGIRAGVTGVLGVMRHLGMLPARARQREADPPAIASTSTWARAPIAGVVRTLVPLGARVTGGQTLAVIGSPLGNDEVELAAPYTGIVIGRANIPLAYEGEALFHIARVPSPDEVAEAVEEFRSTHTDDAATLGWNPPAT